MMVAPLTARAANVERHLRLSGLAPLESESLRQFA